MKILIAIWNFLVDIAEERQRLYEKGHRMYY